MHMIVQGETTIADAATTFDTVLEEIVDCNDTDVQHARDLLLRWGGLHYYTAGEHCLDIRRRLGLLTAEDLEDGTAVQEKVYAY